MINVLHLGVGNLYGGIETMLATVARQQNDSLGVRHEFSVCFEGQLSAELEAAGATVHRLGPVRASRPWWISRARRRLRQVMAEREIDVAICHSGWTMAILWPALRSALRIFWAHNDWTTSDSIQRWALRRAPGLIVANSAFTASSLGRTFPDARIDLIHCPVESGNRALTPSARTKLRLDLGTPGDATVIVQVSRMEHWKGHVDHLRALAMLNHIPGWQCWFVGGPQNASEEQYVARLKTLAAELGIAHRIVFAGARRDVRQLIGAADIFCQPNSGPEPFGIVFAEALYCSRPVVTTAMGGVLDLVDSSCGILVRPGDVGQLAGALEELILNPARGKELGAAGPARALTMTDPARQLRRLAELLRSHLRDAAAERGVPG